jgi:hypothetical protein
MAAADVAVAATGVGSATGLRLYPFTLSTSAPPPPPLSWSSPSSSSSFSAAHNVRTRSSDGDTHAVAPCAIQSFRRGKLARVFRRLFFDRYISSADVRATVSRSRRAPSDL